jgi:pimeloyl-ACP methyl ester carboxylesterase
VIGRRAFATLAGVVFLAHLTAQPPPTPPDLNGAWMWGLQSLDITQKGNNITLTLKSGQKFTGTFADGKIELSSPLTMDSVKKGIVNSKYPPQVQIMMVNGWVDFATGQTRKAIDNISGTVSDDGDTIKGDFEEDSLDDVAITHGKYTIVKSSRVKHTIRIDRIAIHAYWQRPDDTPDRYYRADGKGVLPVKYMESRPVNLMIVAHTNNTDGFAETIDLNKAITEIKIKQTFGDQQTESRAYHEGDFTTTEQPGGWVLAAFDADELLRGVNTKINRNLLQASVKFKLNGHDMQADTKTPLLILRQKLIVFISGVMGSEITAGSGLAYPRLSTGTLKGLPVIGWQPFEDLASNADGSPVTSATFLKLFETYSLGPFSRTVYSPPTWRGIIDHPETVPELGPHPALLIDGKEAHYYLYRPWSYDWRQKLEGDVNGLLGSASGSNPSVADQDPPDHGYPSPPSIQQMLADEKAAHPFLDDKVALVGHSTGGLIERGLLTSSGDAGQTLVDHAFFVDVPFWGAPKAYYVFLSGDMLPDLISPEQMRWMAPNTPIVYYLAPTEEYTDFVAITDIDKWNTDKQNRVSKDKFRRYVGQHVSEFMNPLSDQVKSALRKTQVKAIAEAVLDLDTLKKAVDLDPLAIAKATTHLDALKAAWDLMMGNLGLQWNDGLETAANQFQQSIQGEPAIGFENSVVFWSSGHPTPGPVYVDKDGNPATLSTDGDGTVPLLSQQADFPKGSLLQLQTSPVHDDAANATFVWQTVLQKLADVPQGDDKKFTGTKPIDRIQTQESIPPGEPSRKDKCAEAQKRLQNALQQLAAAQQELDMAKSDDGVKSATAKVQQLQAAVAQARSDYTSLVEELGENAMNSIVTGQGFDYTPLLPPSQASHIAQGFDGVYWDMDKDQAIVIAESKGGYNGQGLDGILGEGYGYRQGTIGWVKGAARKIVQRQIPANATNDQKNAMQKEKEVAQKILDALASGKHPVRVQVFHTPHTGCVAGPTSIYQTDQTPSQQ